MEAAEEFVSGWTFEEFTEDRKTQFAVIRALDMMCVKNILLFRGKTWQGYETN
jgi:uncharacterized protein with HEPN domain